LTRKKASPLECCFVYIRVRRLNLIIRRGIVIVRSDKQEGIEFKQVKPFFKQGRMMVIDPGCFQPSTTLMDVKIETLDRTRQMFIFCLRLFTAVKVSRDVVDGLLTSSWCWQFCPDLPQSSAFSAASPLFPFLSVLLSVRCSSRQAGPAPPPQCSAHPSSSRDT